MQITLHHSEDPEQLRHCSRQERNPVHLEERQNPVVEHIGAGQGIVAAVESGTGDLEASAEEGWLADASDAVEGADAEHVLMAQ
jgi:hypothetical protein